MKNNENIESFLKWMSLINTTNQSQKDRSIPSKNITDNWISCAGKNVTSFNSNEKTGKWCIFLTEKEVDVAWSKIKKALKQGKLTLAKVATKKNAHKFDNTYVICIYTNNWADEQELTQTRDVLYELGWIAPLKYKRDIETINNVYGENEFYLIK